MEIVVIALAALFASCLTLFSGFGLGTLLMPVGARLVKKLTITAVQRIVSVLLVIVGIGLILGIL